MDIHGRSIGRLERPGICAWKNPTKDFLETKRLPRRNQRIRRYTTDWTDPEGDDEALSYFVEPFGDSTEANFEFSLPVKELTHPKEARTTDPPDNGPEDRSLGEASVPLSTGWIQDQLDDGKLPPVGLSRKAIGLGWSAFRKDGEEQHPDQVKSIVSPTDYEKVEVETGRAFLMRKSMSTTERKSYVTLLKEYSYVFAGVRTTCKEYLRS